MSKENYFFIDANARFLLPETVTKPVRHGVDILFRDIEKVLGHRPLTTATRELATVVVQYATAEDPVKNRAEAFGLRFETNPANGQAQMVVSGSDDLGIIYGLLYISREFLGISPFWFWADQQVQPRKRVEISIEEYLSPEAKVRYRGWFVNDEVCLIGWTNIYPPPREVWFPVFEALLRCGGNMVIPGTDLPREGGHWEFATEMGLYITHHHAEPLGAEMFLRAYPDRQASYDQHPELYEGLWEESIRRRKSDPVVWALGFRGQSDCPFWEQDPSYDTPQKRGELISRAIRKQYEMVKKYVKDPVFATYLYGELTELYRDNFLEIPAGVIKIWADNGYGAMVSRRQWITNPRVPALPSAKEQGPHGLYYHITFHDLQASNHLTMFPSDPQLVVDELTKAFAVGADRFLLLNSGNIKPHIYLLEIVSQMWQNGKVSIEEALENFCRRYFPTAPEKVAPCYAAYFQKTIRYGVNLDDRCGEEYYHHPARAIIRHWLSGETENTDESLIWATECKHVSFKEQVETFYHKLQPAVGGWEDLERQCRDVSVLLGENAAFFNDHLWFQVKLHLSGNRGFLALCRSFFAAQDENYPLAFVYASQAIWDYTESLKAMEEAEHDRWENFYRADWLTNVKSTIYSLEGLRKWLRVMGDGPDFFRWYKEFLLPDSEKGVFLENTHRNPLPDDLLAQGLKEKFKGEGLEI